MIILSCVRLPKRQKLSRPKTNKSVGGKKSAGAMNNDITSDSQNDGNDTGSDVSEFGDGVGAEAREACESVVCTCRQEWRA